MSKVEVDLAALAAAISNTIMGFAKAGESVQQFNEKPEVPKKKRGRPKKQKVDPAPIIEDDAYISPNTYTDFTAPSRREDFNIEHGDGDSKKPARRVPFKKKIRVNQWQDDLSMATNALYNDKGEKIVYPQHAPPRPEQKEQKYICDNCHKSFMAFPSYIPGKIEGHQPMIKCYNCNTK
jgi:hypothetical protein